MPKDYKPSWPFKKAAKPGASRLEYLARWAEGSQEGVIRGKSSARCKREYDTEKNRKEAKARVNMDKIKLNDQQIPPALEHDTWYWVTEPRDGSEWCIEALDVQTGAMRLDVCGKIDLSHFSEVIELIDI
ncbi:MAG: hypothetical protein ACTSV7_00560, partial [Candidatus Baldrarchaeia archaeon]